MPASYQEGLQGWQNYGNGYGYSDDTGFHSFTPGYFYNVNAGMPTPGSEVGLSPDQAAELARRQAAAANAGGAFDESSFLKYIRYANGIDPSVSDQQLKDYYVAKGLPGAISSNSLWKDMAGVAGIQLSDAIKQWSAHPDQAILGANTPITADIWNGILGTNYQPLVSNTGGRTDQTFQEAEQKGYDTEADRGAGFMADSIAAGTAAGYGANALAGAGATTSASGAPAGFGDAGYSFAGEGLTGASGATVTGGSSSENLAGDAGNDTLTQGGSMGDEGDMNLGDWGIDEGSSSSAAGAATSSTADSSIDWGSLLDNANKYKGLLGTALGAILGGSSGGSKPAGSTTSTQDVPAWLMPYVQGNLDLGTLVRNGLLVGPKATSAAMPEYMKTINGAYLDPATNPYLDATYKHAAGLVGADVDSRFAKAGRYGSGAHQGVLQEGLNNLATNIYGGNYQQERTRQAAAITGAPTFDSGVSTAAFAPLTSYNGLFPNSRSTTSPYFTNQLGGILSGALAGGAIASKI